MSNQNYLSKFRNTTLLVAVLCFSVASAQDSRPLPQISVSGEGKVKVAPDQATISVSVETRGADATQVKKENDQAVEKVIQFIRKSNVPKEDVQTQRVGLNPQYDYGKKKYTHVAVQTIEILLKDLSKYDALMGGLVESGINRINKVEFGSSKLAMHQAAARKLAIQEAKGKAEDYVSVIGQKVGKAYMINDNSQIYYPQPMMYDMAKAGGVATEETRETLAIGEINITANVTVSFLLD
ncbi:MAG TPA: SIMPL domain-containing protein [Flavobacterium sp.]|jgi:hypothetical protein